MGYLRRLLLVNSAGYPFADVRLDGHCDMAGGQGVGKTTLMNAILFPFVVEDHLLDIDKFEKTRFSLYYFPEPSNSFVIYEMVNNHDVPYSVFIHRIGQALSFHFINAPFDMEWLYDGDEQVKDWQAVRAKLNEAGISYRPVNTMAEFNDIILGKGKSFNEQYSLVRSPKDKDAIRPLLSAIFKSRPFTQETLKESLVAAVMSSNQVESESIELGSHRRNLEGFMQRYNDIKKMTQKNKDGQSVIDELADEIFRHVDDLEESRVRRNRIPGLLAYAIPRDSREIQVLSDAKDALATEREKLGKDWEEQETVMDADIQAASGEEAVCRHELEAVTALKKKYREADNSLDDLAHWVHDKAFNKTELDAAKERYDHLTADSRQLRRQMEEAQEKNTSLYEKKALALRQSHDDKVAQLRQGITDCHDKEQTHKDRIEGEYKVILGEDWQQTELLLLDDLVQLSVLLANCETIAEVREAAASLSCSEELSSILDDILSSRNGKDHTDMNALREQMEKAREDMEKEIDRKAALDRKKAGILEDIRRVHDNMRAELARQISEADETLKVDLKNNEDERIQSDLEIREEFEAKIHGNDPALLEAIEKLGEKISDLTLMIKQADAYPTAVEDKKRIEEEPGLRKCHDSLSLNLARLRDEKRKARQSFQEEDGRLDTKIQEKKAKLKGTTDALEKALRFLENRSAVRAAYEGAEPIATDSPLEDILTDYNLVNEKIRQLEESIRISVPKLYGPNMLSRVDTFQLGIGLDKTLSTLDDYLSVADKLRIRLENSEEGMGLDKFIRVNTDIWLNEIRDISTVMGPVESMLMQIQKLCRQATDFMKKHNTTDCIDSFRMEVNEKDSTNLVHLLRKTAQFYKDNYAILGFDNLFGSEDEPANKEATSLLEKISDELDKTNENTISISSMFDIKMDVTEKGTPHTDILSFNAIGSKGTANVLKAMLNMTLLHIILGRGQAGNARLICAIDEMNTIEARNLNALKQFAEAAGLFIFGSGQHHTQSALDYSYNVWDERDEDGNLNKYVSMDAALEDPRLS
ncbi:MAG: ATP-binding protein [Bacteroidales bacterium]|nr:ATP-binding protein [Bacteroidales bacterium]